MRNPELPTTYVLAVLETLSEELNMTREEHVDVLWAAAVNPRIVEWSRRYGRKKTDDYGRMWELCLNKWMDPPPLVPLLFFKYV
jgi:hypothetical protein